MTRFERVTLGRTGLSVSRMGLSAGYGLPGADVEYAFERGVNFVYWGSIRRDDFGRGVRAVARRHREDLVVVVQTYSRSRLAMKPSVHSALSRLGIEYADILLLGWWNHAPPQRILDGALALREAGAVRHIMISGHHRPAFQSFIRDPVYDAIMVRYNAAHRGAEQEVFPYLDQARDSRPGVVTYTSTRWGTLMKPGLVPDGEAVPRARDCYRFVLSNPDVDMCLSGARNRAELEDTLAALEAGPMDPDELAWMRRVGDAVHARTSAESIPTRVWKRVKDGLRRDR